MKVLTKITDTISKVAEWIIMAMILGLVGLIVTALRYRKTVVCHFLSSP